MKRSNRFILRLSSFLATILLITFVLSACGEIMPGAPTQEQPSNNIELEDTKKSESFVCYAASSESNKYHRPSCYYVDKILDENLIYFYSESSAQRAGYSPCSVCNP